LQGASLVAIASGFLNPANNSNGPNFGIWVSLPAGGDLIPLPLVTSLETVSNKNVLSVYPNPANDKLMIANPIINSERTVVTIFNQLGEVVLSQQIAANSTAIYTLEIDKLTAGLYTVELLNNQTRLISKISITK
jgi:hypothetical protein